MNTGSFRGVPLQMLDDAWPTNPHPDQAEGLPTLTFSGPPLQMLGDAEPSAMDPADTKLIRDLITRLGPDAIQRVLDEHRRAG